MRWIVLAAGLLAAGPAWADECGQMVCLGDPNPVTSPAKHCPIGWALVEVVNASATTSYKCAAVGDLRDPSLDQ